MIAVGGGSGAAATADGAAGLGLAVAAPTVLFVGDDFGAKASASYSCGAATLLAVGCEHVAVAGAQYIATDDATSRTMLNLLRTKQELDGVRYVVLSGSAADARQPASALAAAAAATITEARLRFPDASIVVLAPFANTPSAVTTTLQVAARQSGAFFVDVPGQLSAGQRATVNLGKGRTLTPAGHTVVAATLAKALKALPS